MGTKSPGPLGNALKEIIAGLKQKGRFTIEDIVNGWRKAVGKRAAGHTRPVALKKSKLVVLVDDSSWLYELTTKKKDILKKLDTGLKEANIREIRFRIGEVGNEKRKKDKS